MPQSIYDNGGMIGATLDLASTERYVIGTTTGRATPVYVGGTTAAGAGSAGPGTVSLTSLTGGIGTAPQQGDLILVAYAIGSTTDINVTITMNNGTDVVEVADLYANDTVDTNLGVYWAVAVATPPTTITAGSTGSTANAGAMAVHVWRNIDTDNFQVTVPLDVTTTTATATNSALANPPAITTSTENAVVIAIGASGNDNATTPFTQGGDLSNFISIGGSDTEDATVGMGSIATTTPTTVDPAAFSIATSTAYSWAAATVALRPKLIDIPIYGNFKNSGIWSLSAALDSIVSESVISLVSSTTSSTNSIIVPTVSAGDLAVLLNVAQTPNVTTPPAAVLPSGFTTVFNYSVNGSTTNDAQRSMASIKILDGSESGSSLSLMNGDRDSAVLMIFRNSSGTISSATVRGLSGGSTQSDPTAITTDLTVYTKPLIFIGSYGGDGITVTDATSTPAISEIAASTASTNQLIAGYKIYNLTDNLESITIDQPDIDVNSMASFVLEIGTA